ncbi:hypothetical protein EEJ96_08325, partial [Salmonella enterica]|nr:hypothetical protein [Salmonella enterica]MHF48276.1 hypothetical protein [Salmonella enterica]
ETALAVAMLSPIDCITTFFFQKPASFQISDKTPLGIFLRECYALANAPDDRYILIIFTRQMKTQRLIPLAAPLSAHSTHSLKQKGFFRKGPGVSRIKLTGKSCSRVRSSAKLSFLTFCAKLIHTDGYLPCYAKRISTDS